MTDKTAMQTMIEYLLGETEMLMDKTRMILVAKADSLLELEKKTIKNAYAKGILDGCVIHERASFGLSVDPEDYYNQTFNK